MNHPADEPAETLAPLAERDRMPVLDCLRGVAILGIALVNVQFFVNTYESIAQWTCADPVLGNAILRAVLPLLAEYQFCSIFAILFGIGLALQDHRARQKGRSVVGIYLRRVAVLGIIGVAHGVLLWYGDILALYALAAFVALWCRRLPGRLLLVLAGVLFLLPVGYQMARMAQYPKTEWRLRTWEQMQADVEARLRTDETAASQSTMLRMTRSALDTLADEQRIYTTGTWADMVRHRAILFAIHNPQEALTYMGWRALALMLFGIWIVRRQWFDGSDDHGRFYKRLAIAGLGLGIPLEIAAVCVLIHDPYTAWAVASRFAANYIGSFAMALGYIGIIAWLCSQPTWCRRLLPVAAVGRTALTNYLGQSLLFGLVFYGYGLGWFSQASRFTAELVAIAALALQLLISSLWLKHFLYGPIEWLWRTLTYAHLPPMQR